MKLKSIFFLLLIIGMAKNTLAQNNKAVAVIPFEIVHNSIILKIKINNKVLRLLFDTGANGMAVDKSLADTLKLQVTRSNNTLVVGGSMKIDISENNDIEFETGFVLKSQSIAIFTQTGKEFDGILGNIITRSYVTKIDFNKKEISLYNFEGYKHAKEETVVPVTIPEGVFIVPGKVEIVASKVYNGNFVFDTGAAYNLIGFRPFVRQNKLLVSGFVSDYPASTVSLGVSSPTFNGKAKSFSFINTPVINDMPISLMAGGGQNEKWAPSFDGSIGMGIITRYNFTINYKKNEIYLVPNHSYKYPQNFNMGSYILGFTLNGDLEVLSKIRAIDAGQLELKKGTQIISLNGISANTLLLDAKKLQQLKSLPSGTALEINYLNNTEKGKINLTK